MKKITALLILLIFLFGNSRNFPQKLFEGNGLHLELSQNHLIIYKENKKLVDIASINFNFTPPKTISVLNKTEKEVQLKYVYPGVAEYQGTGEDLVDTLIITKFENGFRFLCNPEWARNTTIRLEDLNEHYFGVLEHLFPNNKKSPDLRGKVVDVDILGNADQYHENHAGHSRGAAYNFSQVFTVKLLFECSQKHGANSSNGRRFGWCGEAANDGAEHDNNQ